VTRNEEKASTAIFSIKRIKEEGGFKSLQTKPDYDAEMRQIFESDNPYYGDSRISDTIVTIYPAGK
jgi:hypothetical protein